MSTTNKKSRTSYGTADDYRPSEEVTAAASELAAAEQAKPQGYTSAYQESIRQALDRILNRDAFSYDAASDELYRQYEQLYTQAGCTAMKDTMGQAAALTGGYGSSYAQTAGQQQYNAYMQQLAAVVPQLEQRAYERYRDAVTDGYDQLSALTQLDDTAYGRYRDSVSDWQNDRSYAYGKYSDLSDRDAALYQTYLDRFLADRDFAYQYDRDAIEDAQRQQEFDEQVRQYNQTEQRIVSLAQQEAQAKLAEAQAQNGKAENPLSQEEYIQLYFDAKAVFSGGNVEALHAFLNSEVANGYLTAQGAEALRKLVYTSEQYQP